MLNYKTEFELDRPRIAGIWRSVSVVRPWLLDLVGDNPALVCIAPYAAD